MITEVREAEWALHRARRLLHDARVDALHDTMRKAKLSSTLERVVGEFFTQEIRDAQRLVCRRQAELELAHIRAATHVAILDGAL